MTFDGNVTGGAWNIETGGDNGDTAAVKFRGNATLTSLNIDKEDANAEATVTFDGSSAQTIAGNITTTANNDGVLVISNTHNNGVTFNDDIGTSARKIGTVNITVASTFSSTVNASTLDIDTDAGA